MANEKRLQTRIQLKHDSQTNWDKAENFIPKAGELILYDDSKKIKIGDGVKNVKTLPFSHMAWSDIDFKPTAMVKAKDVALDDVSLPQGVTKIPTHLSDLIADNSHMTVTKEQIDFWNTKEAGESGGSGTLDHNALINRNAVGAHEIFAITGLRDELDGKLNSSELQPSINKALAEAKASGDFKGDPGKDGAAGAPGKQGPAGRNGVDGAPGKQGPAGKDGMTPVKGQDYFTESDKSELVTAVLAKLPKWDGGGTY